MDKSELQQQYSNECAKLGHLEIQIQKITQKIDELSEKLNEISIEKDEQTNKILKLVEKL